MENERRLLKAPIGSFLLWLVGAYYIIMAIINLGYVNFPDFAALCSGILLILLGVFSLKNNNKLLLFVSIAYSVCELIGFIIKVLNNRGSYGLFSSHSNYGRTAYLPSVFMLPGLLLMIFIIAAQVIPALKSKKHISSKLEFVSFGFFSISTLFSFLFGDVRRIDITYVILIIGICFLLDRVIDPYKIITIPSEDDVFDTDEYCEIYNPMVKHVLLCFFTFGIWYFIWIYRSTKYLNRAKDSEQSDPTKTLLLCIFVPFYIIFWHYKNGHKLDIMMKDRNISGGNMTTLCLVLGIFLPIVACFIMQDKYNQLCTAPKNSSYVSTATPTEENASEPQVMTESETITALKSYKELLDNGIITQEEFDTKKQQLLGQ